MVIVITGIALRWKYYFHSFYHDKWFLLDEYFCTRDKFTMRNCELGLIRYQDDRVRFVKCKLVFGWLHGKQKALSDTQR